MSPFRPSPNRRSTLAAGFLTATTVLGLLAGLGLAALLVAFHVAKGIAASAFGIVLADLAAFVSALMMLGLVLLALATLLLLGSVPFPHLAFLPAARGLAHALLTLLSGLNPP